MLAVVLSGGGNYGAMQAGALEALLQSGVRPEMLVGTSAGALNSIYLATDPTSEGACKLQDVWRDAEKTQVAALKPVDVMRVLVAKQESLVSNEGLRRFLLRHLPANLETFGELRRLQGVSVYTVAVRMGSEELVVFGDREGDRLIDGAMASAAMPPYLPPWRANGERYLDGGVYQKLPLRVAIERGATRILAIDIAIPEEADRTARGLFGLSGYALSLMIESQTRAEVAWAQARRVPLRLFRLRAPLEVGFWDYGKASLLIDLGRDLMAKELTKDPLSLATPRHRVLLDWFRTVLRGTRFNPSPPP